jgi:predicted nucleic-acid-binding protein
MQSADTNVLVRALVFDPGAQEQCNAAKQWLSSCSALFVPQVVQLELSWIMQRVFDLSRAEVAQVLSALHRHPATHLQAADAFEAALTHFNQGGDFADGLILFETSRVGATLTTFDAKFAKRASIALLKLES